MYTMYKDYKKLYQFFIILQYKALVLYSKSHPDGVVHTRPYEKNISHLNTVHIRSLKNPQLYKCYKSSSMTKYIYTYSQNYWDMQYLYSV